MQSKISKAKKRNNVLANTLYLYLFANKVTQGWNMTKTKFKTGQSHLPSSLLATRLENLTAALSEKMTSSLKHEKKSESVGVKEGWFSHIGFFFFKWLNDHLPFPVHLKCWNKTYSISAFSIDTSVQEDFFFVLLLYMTTCASTSLYFCTWRSWYTNTLFSTLSSQMLQGLFCFSNLIQYLK